MPMAFLRPSTVDEAVAAMSAQPGSVALSGGTDLLLDIDDGRVATERIVSLARLPWDRLERKGGRLRIGSTLPIRTLERDPDLAGDLPGLYEAIRSVGSVPLRHRATVGGNIARASPASDLIPVLLALGAQVELVGPSGRRTVPLDRFLKGSRSVDLGIGELIEAIDLPARAASAYAWQRVRPSNDISQVGVAVARLPHGDRWAVALGGIVPRPVRLPAAEAILGEELPSSVDVSRAADVAARDAPFATDRRASETYRRRLVGVLLKRALAKAAPPRMGA
ncbi:MAG: FAD binding domain-containing protein [Thermoplasmata archaeon]|nr:FAD binding domain-containing protein [Thermoplasmata archaeon]MCI4359569.1 FAD binding domain-containing protein [Thermoplasmata archaeon]